MHSMTGLVRGGDPAAANANVSPFRSARHADSIRVIVVHGDPVARIGLQCACASYADLKVLKLSHLDDAPILPIAVLNRDADVVIADYSSAMILADRSEEVRGRRARILIIGGSEREGKIRSALERGVQGYLRRGCSADQIAEAVRAVHRGLRQPPGKVDEQRRTQAIALVWHRGSLAS